MEPVRPAAGEAVKRCRCQYGPDTRGHPSGKGALFWTCCACKNWNLAERRECALCQHAKGAKRDDESGGVSPGVEPRRPTG